MQRKMTEAEILAAFPDAVKNGAIHMYYQPQYNHSTRRLIGAEVLMRWTDPDFGEQFPSDFIPVFEKHGLMHEADLHGFRELCRFQKSCGTKMIPISFNVSRHDLFGHDYVSELEEIRREFDVPVSNLRAEITESTSVGGYDLISDAIRQFHEAGYLVEMDDFGSGYSSLSTLKSLPVDILKLDLRFLSGEGVGGRGGVILNSVVQMAKWLATPTIAEGVETMEQADYLKSIGCNYIQGYVYSKPVPPQEMMEIIQSNGLETTAPAMTLIRNMDAVNFWNPDSLETLIFNNYVGAAAIYLFEDDQVEILRVNEKYVKEIGMNLTEKEILESNPWDNHTPESRAVYLAAIHRAIETGEEESCETWRTIHSDCCGDENICIRSNIRMIAKAGKQAIIYAIIQNITQEKRYYEELTRSERRFRFASEQVNVYAWEYDIDTKEMRPCFRCMRDLGLPPLVRNYPEPAIEAGIFPPDYADMYRDWHRQLENGVGELEGIIPLTIGRVPFRVRYTTEFDENGRPLKAYGSAALVIDEEKQEERSAA